MVDSPSPVESAHGGKIGELAEQFGLSLEKAKAAIESLGPTLAHDAEDLIAKVSAEIEVDAEKLKGFATAFAELAARGVDTAVSAIAPESPVEPFEPVVVAPVAPAPVAEEPKPAPAPAAAAAPAAAPAPLSPGLGAAVSSVINPLFDWIGKALLKKK